MIAAQLISPDSGFWTDLQVFGGFLLLIGAASAASAVRKKRT